MLNKLKKYLKEKFPLSYSRLVKIKVSYYVIKFKIVYRNVRLFRMINSSEQKYYSQHNQDYIIYNTFFKNKHDGFFCDIGGNHPLKINNTRYFEEIGWSGIAFEPIPYMAELWKKYRKAKLFPLAISDSIGEVDFTVINGNNEWEDMLSYVDSTVKVDYKYQKKSITVNTDLLKNILSSENISVIDYLSFDVEGNELNVLNGIDFDKVYIKVISLENCYAGVGDKRHHGDDSLRKILVDNNFIFWGRIIGLDDIFINKNFI